MATKVQKIPGEDPCVKAVKDLQRIIDGGEVSPGQPVTEREFLFAVQVLFRLRAQTIAYKPPPLPPQKRQPKGGGD